MAREQTTRTVIGKRMDNHLRYGMSAREEEVQAHLCADCAEKEKDNKEPPIEAWVIWVAAVAFLALIIFVILSLPAIFGQR